MLELVSRIRSFTYYSTPIKNAQEDSVFEIIESGEGTLTEVNLCLGLVLLVGVAFSTDFEVGTTLHSKSVRLSFFSLRLSCLFGI